MPGRGARGADPRRAPRPARPGLTAVVVLSLALGIDGRAEGIDADYVTGGFLPMPGVRPALGRMQGPDDDRADGDAAVAVPGWETKRALDPHGRTCGRPDRITEAPCAGCNEAVSEPMEIRRQRTDILRIAERHGARNVRVFGSAARGEARLDGDVDFLVEIASDRSLLDLVGLEQDLEELLQRKVDVLTDASLHPRLRHRILAEARAL